MPTSGAYGEAPNARQAWMKAMGQPASPAQMPTAAGQTQARQMLGAFGSSAPTSAPSTTPMRFNTGGAVDPMAGKQTGTESSLSSWAGPYVTDMMAKGQALSETPYEAYTGPLTAGSSNLQQQAFGGLAGLTLPTETQTSYTPGSFTTAGAAASYMSPYLTAALEPQIAEARRQAEINRVNNAGRMTRAGAYGGGRQAIMESELDRNLTRGLADITGKGYQDAFTAAQNQFNTEEARRMAATGQAQQYGLQALGAQLGAGNVQRGIESEGVAADIKQFEEERDFPYKQVQFQQSLLQGLPLATQSYSYQEPTGLSSLLGGAGSILGLLEQFGIGEEQWKKLLGGLTGGNTTPETPAGSGEPVITQAEYDQFMGED